MRKSLLWFLRGGTVLSVCLLAVLWSLQRLSAESGLIEIGDDEVAVVYNQWNGSTREIDTPGNEIFIPFLERIYLQRRSPKRLILQGAERKGLGLVPEVRLRVSDGSLVRFESLAVQYRVRSDAAQVVLEDMGGSEQIKSELIEAHTRSIVRDEFGSFSAEEILQRENQKAASVITLSRLNSALAPHGIEVIELSTPKLRFDSAYEKSVEERKLAYQEVERLKAEFRQLGAERDQRLAALEKEKLIELNQTRLDIGEYMAKMARDARARRLKVQHYRAGRVSEAEHLKYKLEQEALASIEQHTLRAETLRQEVELLAQTGASLVREAWIERLASTSIRIQPFSRDPRPAGIEVIQAALASH